MTGAYFRSTAPGHKLIYCTLPPEGPVPDQPLKRLAAEGASAKLPVYYLVPAAAGEDGPYRLKREKHGLKLQGPEVSYREIQPLKRRGILWHPWVWLGILLLGLGLALLIGRFLPSQAPSTLYAQEGRGGRLELNTEPRGRTRAILLREGSRWELYLPAPSERERDSGP